MNKQSRQSNTNEGTGRRRPSGVCSGVWMSADCSNTRRAVGKTVRKGGVFGAESTLTTHFHSYE